MENREIEININSKIEEPKKKKHRILFTLIKIILIIISIIVLFIVGFVGYSTIKNGWGLKGMIKTVVGATGKSAEELGEFQTLILGISKDISSDLTDTIMVASYNPETQKAVLLSIPRDTFVGKTKTKADSYDKLNAIYQISGPEGAMKEVNKVTGLNLKKYIVISNNALIELVDEIGGVEFDVPDDMDYDSYSQDLHIHLKKGYQKLDGEQAEGLVRFRKNNDGTTYSGEHEKDDFGRMQTQQEFLKAVAEQTLQAKNITKIGALIDVVKNNITTNIKNWDEIKEYIPYIVDFNTNNLETETIPGESTRIPAGTGLWFFLPYETQTKTLVKELFSTQNQTLNEKKSKKSEIKIELLNGTKNSKLTEQVEEILVDAGYTIYKKGNVTTTANTTIINRGKYSDDTVAEIKAVLKSGIISNSSSSNKTKADITIIIGNDYK